MKRFDKFWYGFGLGLIFPAIFLWVYLSMNFPDYAGLLPALKSIFPSALLGKLLILSILPDLLLCFAFYKTDTFKLATGFLSGGMPCLIGSFTMI